MSFAAREPFSWETQSMETGEQSLLGPVGTHLLLLYGCSKATAACLK